MKNFLPFILLSLMPGWSHADTAAAAPIPEPSLQFNGAVQVDALACDTQGDFYVGDSTLGKVLKYSAQGALVGTEGQGNPAAAIGYPASMAVSGDGRLAVADDDNNVLVLYGSDGCLSHRFGAMDVQGEATVASAYPANNEPWLNDPEGVAFGPDNRVYVSDSNHSRVAVFDATSGAFLFSWSNVTSATDTLYYPAGLWVAGGDVYVTDSGNGRIVEFDADGNYLRTVGSSGRGPGQFADVFAVVVDALGRIWAADEGLNKVTVFNPDGSLLTEYGVGFSPIVFDDLSSLAVNPDGTVLAADADTNQVYAWHTGLALSFYGKATPTPQAPAPTNVYAGTLAFGPVPAHAGQSLSLRLPFTADTLHYEIYTADLRKVAEGTESGQDQVVFDRTSDLASGVYIARLSATENGATRQAIQKLVITR